MEKDLNLLDQLLGDDDENVFFFDEDGNETEFEQVATINHGGEWYAVLHEIGFPEEEVVVFKINPDVEDSVIVVEDEDLANKILNIVMEEAKKND